MSSSWLIGRGQEKTKDERKKDKNYTNQVGIPHVQGVSERFDCVLKKYGVTTFMCPRTTLRRLLVHTKNKLEPEEQGELFYQTTCKSCGTAYIGETGRLLNTRPNEHKKDVENAQKEQYTRSEEVHPHSPPSQSALTVRPHSPPSQTALTVRPHSPPSQSALTVRPHSPPSQSALTDRPHSPPSQSALTVRPHSPPSQSALTDRPHRPPSQTALTDRPHRPPSQSALTVRPHSPPSQTT